VKFFIFGFVTIFAASGAVFAQETASLNEEILPPLLTMSKAEQTQLAAETDFKRRTLLCLQLADSRLQRAEQATTSADFQAALDELGSYQAILDHSLNFMQRNNNDSSRVRDNFKRMEISLRAHTTRLETIRRTTPFEYAGHLKKIMTFTRNARARALSSLFSDTVLSGEASEASESENTVATEKKP
jgi:hypothetical protein